MVCQLGTVDPMTESPERNERLTWEGGVGRSASPGYRPPASSTPDPDEVRRHFETIGALFANARVADDESIGHESALAVEGLAGFLDDVRRALLHDGLRPALLAALVSYETARTRP